jgi:hypothetical protein
MDNPTIDKDGNKWWYDSNGKFHRDDDPAVVRANGTKVWYQHGNIHRDNGPAVECASGDKWWLNSQYMSFDEWLDQVDISDEAKVMMKLKYG